MTLIILAFLLLLPAWAYAIASVCAAIRFAQRPSVAEAAGPPLTILKPLHGDEPGLEENLRSFIDQDGREVQVVFGMRSPSDTALPVARRVIRSRPGRDLGLVVNPRATGSNLKIANIENMLPSARHRTLVFADSDMRVTPSYAAEVAQPLADPRVGLVTCLYSGASTGGLWSQLGAMHINYAFLPGALVGDLLGWGGGCFGATIALRRDVLDRIGGFARVRNELADDHRMGAAVRQLGLKVVVSRYIVENRVTETSFQSLWRHELRWARTTRLMAPGGFAGAIVTHTMVLAALAAVATGLSLTGLGLFAMSCVLRWGAAAVVARLLNLPMAKFWLLPVRDVLSFAVFVASFCGRRVSWRDQVFRVEASGRMTADGEKPV